jgi:hypothetical protein
MWTVSVLLRSCNVRTDQAHFHGTKNLSIHTFHPVDDGMNSGIPFIKIADRVEVTVSLKARKVSGPLRVYPQ